MLPPQPPASGSLCDVTSAELGKGARGALVSQSEQPVSRAVCTTAVKAVRRTTPVRQEEPVPSVAWRGTFPVNVHGLSMTCSTLACIHRGSYVPKSYYLVYTLGVGRACHFLILWLRGCCM